MWMVLDACLGGLLHPYVKPCVCVCTCSCACVCVHVCVHMCAGVVSKDASQVSAYLDSDGLLRIGVLLKEGDPCYRWGWSPH